MDLGLIYPASLGNIRKQKKSGEWKNRIIQDLKCNSVNATASTWERVVLPRGLDHARDLARSSANQSRVEVLVLDFTDAFMTVPLHQDELKYNCAMVPNLFGDGKEWCVVWRVLGFGGKSNPLVYSRVASFAARSGPSLSSCASLLLQVYIDDPAIVVFGSSVECTKEIDCLLLWWLCLGFRLAWTKGSHAVAAPQCILQRPPSLVHDWVGIRFHVSEGVTILSLTSEFIESTLQATTPFLRKRGSAPLSAARSLVGKAARVAQVVADTMPFSAAL